MINLIRAEFYKLGKSMSIKVCFLLSCISAVSLIYISHSIAVGSMNADVSSSASGLTEIVIVSLLGTLMAGILVSSDFESKTIHDEVSCGNGRMAIIISKTLVYFLIIVLLLIPYAVTTIVAFCMGAEFTKPFVASAFIGILSDVSGHSVTAGAIGKIIVLSFTTMLVHAARLSVCIPIAFKIRKPVVILTIGFVFNGLIDLVIGLIKDVPVVSDIFSITPFSREFILLSMDTGAGPFIKAAICCIVFMVIIIALTYAIFRKAEIK